MCEVFKVTTWSCISRQIITTIYATNFSSTNLALLPEISSSYTFISTLYPPFHIHLYVRVSIVTSKHKYYSQCAIPIGIHGEFEGTMLVLLIVHLLFLLCSNPGSCNISTASLAGVWTQCVCWLFGLVGALLCVSLYFDIRKIALSISVVFVVFIV